MSHRKKLIEVALPLEAINEEASLRKRKAPGRAWLETRPREPSLPWQPECRQLRCTSSGQAPNLLDVGKGRGVEGPVADRSHTALLVPVPLS